VLVLERFRPLRRCVEPKLRRMARNVTTGLHGTMLLSVPQDEITIDVPAYHDPET
jgi:hypothetical protein